MNLSLIVLLSIVFFFLSFVWIQRNKEKLFEFDTSGEDEEMYIKLYEKITDIKTTREIYSRGGKKIPYPFQIKEGVYNKKIIPKRKVKKVKLVKKEKMQKKEKKKEKKWEIVQTLTDEELDSDDKDVINEGFPFPLSMRKNPFGKGLKDEDNEIPQNLEFDNQSTESSESEEEESLLENLSVHRTRIIKVSSKNETHWTDNIIH
jgi:hypothetical protein